MSSEQCTLFGVSTCICGLETGIISSPASAAVERSVSKQGLLLNQQRGKGSVETVKHQTFVGRVDWARALQDYIERNSHIDKT